MDEYGELHHRFPWKRGGLARCPVWRARRKHLHVLFEQFLEQFFADDDAAFLQSLGLSVVRLPINYRHFESDMEPFTIRDDGFRHLDRVIDLCATRGIYTIIDLHAVQGYQNQDWHSDNPTHRSFLWTQKVFQDRALSVWESIADHYRGNRWVAGYNLINEPNDPSRSVVVSFQKRLIDVIRAIDGDHLIYLDGNGTVVILPSTPSTGLVWCTTGTTTRHPAGSTAASTPAIQANCGAIAPSWSEPSTNEKR